MRACQRARRCFHRLNHTNERVMFGDVRKVSASCNITRWRCPPRIMGGETTGWHPQCRGCFAASQSLKCCRSCDVLTAVLSSSFQRLHPVVINNAQNIASCWQAAGEAFAFLRQACVYRSSKHLHSPFSPKTPRICRRLIHTTGAPELFPPLVQRFS